jgi:CHASE2 domain-containing sensor protein
MPLSFILVMVGLGAYFAVVITALIVHGIWVAPFIERHGVRTAGFAAHWIFGIGLVRDYLTARRLCRQRGIRPPWMRWFTSLLLLVGILAGGLVAFLLCSFGVK